MVPGRYSDDSYSMYSTSRDLQKIKTCVKQVLNLTLLLQWSKWLAQKKRMLALVILGGIVIKLVLDRSTTVTLQGEIMNMSYQVRYLNRWGRNYQQDIDDLVVRLHQVLSLDLPDSELSQFNTYDCSDFCFESPLFYPVFAKSKEIYRKTDGAFDPTILPLVQAWENRLDYTHAEPDSSPANALCAYVNLDYIVAHERRIKKLKEGVKLDFGGILKGYVVDQIAALLHSRGVEHMCVTLQGKILTNGRPNRRSVWQVDIHPYLAPFVETELQIIMELGNQALAVVRKKSNLAQQPTLRVDPATGHPTQHKLLAAAVVSQDCSTSHAYATAMMVRGVEFAQELMAQQEDLIAFLVYEDDHGMPTFYASPDLHMQRKGSTITLQAI
mmetsp:Transcript_6353/g.14378  ORF Transcript_6353/g.14378 Transcript_6353/m.14378 type:complete len:384 (-) Transcript_6353:434-1585(-)